MSGDRSLEQWLLIKRGLYYRKYSQGYTSVKDEAQMYSHEEALKRCTAIIEDASLAHPGDHETVYAIPDRLAPAYLHGGFPDVIAKHASTTVASLTAERDAAIARAQKAEAERDAARAEAKDEAAEFIFGVLEEALGNPAYSPCDGTETWDGDVAGTVYRLLNASGVRNENTGELATTRAEAAEAQVDALTAKVDALCAKGQCGCSWDREGDVCEYHSPKFVAALTQVDALREALGRFAATSERVDAAMTQPPDDDHDFTPDKGREIVGMLKALLVEMGQQARAALAGKESGT